MATRKEAEQAIKDYPTISQKIHNQELALEYPFDAFPDQNVDGGRAQNVRDESIETMIERKLSDPILAYLENERASVETVLKQCVKKDVRSMLDEATAVIIYEFYFAEIRTHDAVGIGNMVGLSKTRVYARRDAFIKAVQDELTKRDKNGKK